VNGYAGEFSLAASYEGHPAGTLVRVTVSERHPSQLVLAFGERQVLTDACVLLCGHIGALRLLELGYTGRLIRQPRLAACVRSEGSRSAGGATEPLQGS
jgi:hypothetical protein